MKYDYTVIQDGQTYLAGEDVPEMGSLICVKNLAKKVRLNFAKSLRLPSKQCLYMTEKTITEIVLLY